MSSKSVPKLKSGAFEGSKEELKRKVATVVSNGAFQGMMQAIAKISPDLAQRTGAFRRAFAVSAQEIVTEQLGQAQLKINAKDIAKKMTASLNYAEYHIDGKPGRPGDTSPYDYPSTPGTAPLDTDELQRVAYDEIRKAVLSNLRAAELDFVIKK